MANGRTASHRSLGREANLWPGTSRPYVLWLIHMWQQRQGRPAQQRNVRLSSKSPNILGWRISVSSSQLQWSRLVHSMRQLSFLKDLGRRIFAQSGDERERVPSCFKDCCHSAIQRYLAPQRAAELKITKYSGLENKCVFQPIAVESLGPLNETACQFLKDLGRRIFAQSGDERESAFLFQRLLSFSDSTLSCSTTVLRRQTTWANGHSSVYIF